MRGEQGELADGCDSSHTLLTGSGQQQDLVLLVDSQRQGTAAGRLQLDMFNVVIGDWGVSCGTNHFPHCCADSHYTALVT